MKLVIVVHKDYAKIDRLIHAVQAEEVTGFTLLSSHGRGRERGDSHEEFHFSLGHLLAGRDIQNTTVFSIVPDERVPRLRELIAEHMPDLGQPGTGIFAILPVEETGGLV
jgi:nitrogen regulatory protein PII